MTPPPVALLEDLTLTAWPALRTVYLDGWLVRFSAGHTGRANSVNVIGPGRMAPADKITLAEQAYRSQGLDPLFRLTPLCPPDLDGMLAERGYAHENPSLVQVADLAGPVPDPCGAVTLRPQPTPAWIDAWCAMTGVPAPRRAALAGILDAIVPPRLFAAHEQAGEILSVALGVVDRGHVGIFDVATRPDRRGQGLARGVVGAVLAQARAMGAALAYLQVGATNTPAQRLYGRLDFCTVYPYHYRRMKG